MLYCVYVHIFPNGKLYFGVTSQPPIKRWYSNGTGYKKCPLMYKAIIKYGWENINHLILISDINKELAVELEKFLIKTFKTNDYKFGYNLTTGGDGLDGYIHSKETREKRSLSLKGKNKLSKKVIVDGVIYCSVTECSKHIGIPQSTLSRYLRGERHIPPEFIHLNMSFI